MPRHSRETSNRVRRRHRVRLSLSVFFRLAGTRGGVAFATGHVRRGRREPSLLSGPSAPSPPGCGFIARFDGSRPDVSLQANPQKLPSDLHALLGLLLELVYETGGAVSSETRTILSRLSGSSKASRSAKAILSHKGSPPASRIAEIMQADVEARIARAERWQRRLELTKPGAGRDVDRRGG